MLFKKYIDRSNMEEFIKVPKFYLSLLGIWPLGETKFAWIYYLHSFVFAYSVAVLFAVSLSIDLYSKLGDIAETADAMYYYLTQIGFLTKLLIFTYNRKKFIKILDEIENHLFIKHHSYQEKHLKYWSKIINVYSYTFFTCCYVCFLFYTIFPLIDSDPEHILPFGGWFPFDVKNNNLNRSCVYVFQLAGLLFAIMINASMDILPAACMNISCAQMEILKDNLENATLKAEEATMGKSFKDIESKDKRDKNHCELLSKEADDMVYKTLCDCIRHHQAIIKFLSNVEAMFNTGMFIQFIESGITICITGLQLIVVQGNLLSFILTISYMGAILFEIICYCWNGHLVTILSSNISESCYKMDWYRCSPRVRRTIFIIMERCKRPIEMTAGNIFILSIATLTALLRTAYSYFAVLRKVYTE